MPTPKLHDQECELVIDRPLSWGCECGQENDDGTPTLTWFPKSLCEIDPKDADVGDKVTITMPIRIAKEKGLI